MNNSRGRGTCLSTSFGLFGLVVLTCCIASQVVAAFSEYRQRYGDALCVYMHKIQEL